MQPEPEAKLSLAWSSFFCGLGMVVFAALRIQHFFNSNYEVIYGWKGSVCDVGPWLNCNHFDGSPLAQIGSIPFGYFELMVGGLVCLGALFPSPALERTNRSV